MNHDNRGTSAITGPTDSPTRPLGMLVIPTQYFSLSLTVCKVHCAPEEYTARYVSRTVNMNPELSNSLMRKNKNGGEAEECKREQNRTVEERGRALMKRRDGGAVVVVEKVGGGGRRDENT